MSNHQNPSCSFGCEPSLFYSSICLYINNQIKWNSFGQFRPDYISGMCVAAFALLKNSCYFIINGLTNDKQVISQIENINNIGNMGGYISQRNKTTEEALRCLVENCHLRYLGPDDGTKAVWFFDHNEKDGSRWNLIMTDNIKQFIAGADFMSKLLDVNIWNYILGEPIGSEGVVFSWNLLTYDDENYWSL